MTKVCDFRIIGHDDRGTILVFWAVALAAILALVAVSFDLGQRASTQTELQSYADQVALAAAGELDAKSDAITRATNAAGDLISDTQTFASGAKALAGSSNYTLTFFSTLPASDTTALTSGTTTNPALAGYVRVVVTPRTVPFSFWAGVDALSGTSTANPTITASAVAGFTQYACDVTPMMFCLPSPTYKANDHIGTMILLKAGGQGAAWGPGDFGFLDPSKVLVDPNGPCAGLNASKVDRCLIGAEGGLTQCFAQRGVDMEPGQKVGLESALYNVRFDIYNSVMKSYQNTAAYAPAPNVIKGIIPQGAGQTCIGNNTSPSDSVALPQDNCFATSTCANGNRVGDGVWSSATTGRPNYVLKNYNGTDPFPSANTRYKYYLAEIAAHGGAASKSAILTGKKETGRPICSANQSTDVDRRVIIAAGIDCAANNIQGSATNVPVAEFFKFFLTEPVTGTGNANNIYAEIVGSAEGSSGAGTADGIFHDFVQLYR